MKRMWQGKIFKPLMQTVTVGVFVVLPLASSPDTPSKLAAENWRRKYTCRCAFSVLICPGGTLYPADPRSALFLLVGLHVAWVTWVGRKAPSNDPTHVLQPSVYPEKTLDPSISLPYCKKPLSFYLPDCTQRKDRQECCRTSESLPSLSDGVWLGIGQPADNSIPK